jgi:hypothetical protein
MKELMKQIAGDLRAIRRAYEAQVALRAAEHGLSVTAMHGEGCEYARILDALVDRGVITGAKAEWAKIKIRNGEIAW